MPRDGGIFPCRLFALIWSTLSFSREPSSIETFQLDYSVTSPLSEIETPSQVEWILPSIVLLLREICCNEINYQLLVEFDHNQNTSTKSPCKKKIKLHNFLRKRRRVKGKRNLPLEDLLVYVKDRQKFKLLVVLKNQASISSNIVI